MRSFLLNLLTFYKILIDMTLLAKGHGMCFKLSEKKTLQKNTISVEIYLINF